MPGQSHVHSLVIKTVLAANQRLQLPTVTTESDSVFLIERMYAVNSGTFTAQFRDAALSYLWSNLPVANANMFGTVEYPMELIDPIPLPPSTQLDVLLEDTSGAPNTIEITLECYRMYNTYSPVTRRFFQYVTPFALGANNASAFNLQINGDSDFLVKKLVADKAGAATIKMTSTELNGRQLSNDFVSMDNLFGRALRPNILRHPLKMSRNTFFQIEMQDTSGLANAGQLCFEGVKMWGNQAA